MGEKRKGHRRQPQVGKVMSGQSGRLTASLSWFLNIIVIVAIIFGVGIIAIVREGADEPYH